MTPEEFRRYGHRVVDWIADYRTRVAELPVLAAVAPGDVRRRLAADPPERPEPFDAVLEDLSGRIVLGLTHWQHPAFFAYFPSNVGLASVLGDFLSSGLGVIGLNWQASPALTELEQLHHRLAAAHDGSVRRLERHHPRHRVDRDARRPPVRPRADQRLQPERGGLQAEPFPLVVYTSAESHSSVEKSSLARWVRPRARAGDPGIDAGVRDGGPDALRAQLAADQSQGFGALRHRRHRGGRPPRRPSTRVRAVATLARASMVAGCTSMPRWPGPR